jgi:hypothetical protein
MMEPEQDPNSSELDMDTTARELADDLLSVMANDSGLSDSEFAAQKLLVVQRLATTVGSAAKINGTDNIFEFSAETQMQVISAVATLAGGPIAAEEVDLLLEIADAMFGASYTQFSDESMATIALDVTSSLLTMAQASASSTNSSQLQQRGQQVSRIVQSIAQSMAAAVSVGATKVFTSESISISCACFAAADYESDSLGTDIELPDDMFGTASDILVSEVIRWDGAGPHLVGEMPPIANVEEKAQLASNMMSVSFSRKTDLTSYDVRNLEKPIVLSFPVEQNADTPWWKRRKRDDGTAVATVLCTYWDTVSEAWVDDGVGVYNVTAGIASCKFTHLTDFVPVMAPPPLYNKVEFTSVFDFYQQNFTGA